MVVFAKIHHWLLVVTVFVRATYAVRRYGLSSWRVIFYVAEGMLSGKWGGNYVAKSDVTVNFSYERTNLFCEGYFRTFFGTSLAHEKPQRDL